MLTALLIGPSAGGPVRAAHLTSATSLPDSADAAVEFRSSFGLRADPEYVAMAAGGGPEFSNLDWGVPLSAAEAAELQRRLDVRESLRTAIDYASSQPSYAGAYIDQLQGGMPVFLFADPDVIDASKLTAGVDSTTKVVIGKAARTLQQLSATQDVVSGAREKLRDAGLDVTSVSVHVRDNQVEVGVVGPTNEKAAALKQIDPDAVLVSSDRPIADACTITSCPPPTGIIGGLEIIQAGSSICTSGWVGKRLDVAGVTALVTAGHCIRNGALAWHHPTGTTIGTAVTSNGWYDGSWSDVGWIVLNASSIPTTKNRAIYNPDTNKVVSITSTDDANQQLEGDQVCRVGWGSWSKNHNASDPLRNHYTGLQCGTIVLYSSDSDGTTNANSQSCVGSPSVCKYIRYMKVVSFDSTGGDSGGTIFTPTTGTTATLLGTHVHSAADSSTSNRGWYTTYQYNHIELHDYLGYDVVVCLTASCS